MFRYIRNRIVFSSELSVKCKKSLCTAVSFYGALKMCIDCIYKMCSYQPYRNTYNHVVSADVKKGLKVNQPTHKFATQVVWKKNRLQQNEGTHVVLLQDTERKTIHISIFSYLIFTSTFSVKTTEDSLSFSDYKKRVF